MFAKQCRSRRKKEHIALKLIVMILAFVWMIMMYGAVRTYAMVMPTTMTGIPIPGNVTVGIAPDGTYTLPDPEDRFVYHEELEDMGYGLNEELQKYLWEFAVDFSSEDISAKDVYSAYLTVLWGESNFKKRAYNDKNPNGTVDRGIAQINSCHIKDLKKLGMIETAEDLYDPKTGIRCLVFYYNDCLAQFGATESSYFHYNCGIDAKGSSNKNSRTVWAMKETFDGIVDL